MNWYYTENDQQRGPISEAEFNNLVQQGKITADTLVWREGMAAWQPYRDVVAPAGGVTMPPLPVVPAPFPGTGDVQPLRDGPPWEHRATLGIFNAALETIKSVLSEPSDTFSRMKREGDLVNPLFYLALLGTVSGIVSIFIQTMVGPLLNSNSSGTHGARFMAASVIMLPFWAILLPLAIALFSFIHAGILHLSLMLVACIKQPFETTYRVVCYTSGSTAIFQMVPVCGALVGGVWNLVALCIGLARAHEIPTGKAVLGVLLPTICCCGLLLFCFGAVFVALFKTASYH